MKEVRNSVVKEDLIDVEKKFRKESRERMAEFSEKIKKNTE